MAAYVPHTTGDVAAMLARIGVRSLDDLVSHVPAHLRARAAIELPPGMSEPELSDRLADLAARNLDGAREPAFLGAGAYPHVVPTVVDHVLRRAEFATAYTPYQPEVSQGTLQATFEFQTFVALLFGMDVANASVYDGASALAEAVLMARRLLPRRRVAWLARSLHPQYRAVVRTYLRGLDDVELREIAFGPDGRIDKTALGAALGDDALCVVVGYPNVFGIFDDLAAAAAMAHAVGALAISATAEPLALALARSPGAAGADIATAEGQSFGLPLSYGGPGVGLFASRDQFVRSMPGRIVGETVDARGRRGFVLTLATREQHIRRERATSNICTNQGLCALAVSAYLSLLGRNGLRALAQLNYRRAHVVATRLGAAGVRTMFSGPYFNEFVVRLPNAEERWEALLGEQRLVAGLPLARWYPELRDGLLLCVTEVHAERHVERLVAALSGHTAKMEATGG
jgi:glycine dehydrogenase subunit 1